MAITCDSGFYKPNLKRYHINIGSCTFKAQFAQIYKRRLFSCRKTLESSAKRRWGASRNENATLPIRSLADLRLNEKCVIIGTVYKEMRLKPSVIRQLAELEQGGGKKSISVPASVEGIHPPHLTSSEDDVFLEDEVQRIGLQADESNTFFGFHSIGSILVTGVSVALLGCEYDSSNGFFTVNDVSFLEPAPERPINTDSLTDLSHANFSSMGPCIVFVSGLGFMGTGLSISDDHMLALRLLGDWLRGAITFSGSFPKIFRFIILGDSIRSSSGLELESIGLIQQARYLTRKTDADSVNAMEHFDAWLSELPLGPGFLSEKQVSDGIPVDIVPGPSDCVSHLMPQQPLHSAILPNSVSRAGGIASNSIRSTTNPYSFTIADRKILATSGQGITDIFRYTDLKNSLDCMEASLHWGHLAPTCPDTLFGYPLPDKDLLLFQFSEDNEAPDKASNPSSDYPDVYVAGNQPEVAWRRASLDSWKPNPSSTVSVINNGALMISVPRYDTTHTLVIFELATFRCLPVRFDLSALNDS